ESRVATLLLVALTGLGWGDPSLADSCTERCPVPFGANDVVSATQRQNCLAMCRSGQAGGSDTYAAVAVSATTLRAGVAYGEPSRQQAERNSVGSCQLNNGGPDCKSVHWAENSCVGIAISRADKAYGVSDNESSRSAAWTSALSRCREYGGQHFRRHASPASRHHPHLRPPPP